jgi:hypothetical protein
VVQKSRQDTDDLPWVNEAGAADARIRGLKGISKNLKKKVLTHFCASDKTSGSTTGKNKE